MRRAVVRVVGGRVAGEVEGRRVCWPGEVTAGTVALAGWPLGQGKRMVRAIECSSAVKDGAWGVVMCPSADLLKPGDGGLALREELTELARAARAASPAVWLAVGVSRRAVGEAWDALDWTAIDRAAAQSGMDAVAEISDAG